MQHKEMTAEIINSFYKVFNTLGYGFLEKVYEKFAPIEGSYDLARMTAIRNHPDARRMTCEVAATLAMCRKNKLQSLPVIKPTHDFDSVTIQESLKAPSTLYGKVALRRDDPLAVVVPINEFCYCLRQDVRDVTRALYWMSWVYAYAREFKKQTKTAVVFANRSDEFVSVAHGNHVAWLFWDCIRKQSGTNARQYVDVLYRMYCLRWSPSDAKSRQALLTTSVVLVCEGVALDTTPVIGDTIATSTVLNGIPGWIDAITRMQKSFSSEGTK